jgi:membrane protein
MSDFDKEGEDWRTVLERESAAGLHVSDVLRARQKGRGRRAETPEDIPLAGWNDIFWRVARSVPENRLVANAGSVAFFALMSIFPAVATIVSLYGIFADAHTIITHLNLLSGIFPRGVLELIKQEVLRVAEKSNNTLSVAFLVGLLVALWSANSGMSSLFDALNVIYGEKEKRSLLRLYTATLTVTLAFLVFVVAALMAVVILPLAWSFAGFTTSTHIFAEFARWPVLLLLVTTALAIIYRLGPSRRDAKWRWVTWGSVAAACAWVGASMLFSSYVTAFDSYDRIYGSLGAAVGFMTWIWLSVFIILLGAELNAEMEHQTAKDTTAGGPRPLGSRGANMADHVGKSTTQS